MTIYWPKKQSLDLNLAVSNLFNQTYHKFFFSLSNKTKDYLPTDIFNYCTKKLLLVELLIELEILIIDIIELNLSMQELRQLNNHILLHLAQTSARRLVEALRIPWSDFCINFHLPYNQLFFSNHSFTCQTLFTYLIFGSDNINDCIFPFSNKKTPIYHVKALFENIIIETSNIVAFNLIESIKSIDTLYSLFYKSSIPYCYSIRAISNFKNNLINGSLINLYIKYPNHIYCGKYHVYLLSSKGIICRYIYLNRAFNYLKLCNYQLGSIIYLEIQDFLGPRLQLFMISIGKLIIYVLVKIFGKNLQASLKYIAKKLNTEER